MFSLTFTYHLLTAQIGDRLKIPFAHPCLCTQFLRDCRFHAKPIFFCNILFLSSCNQEYNLEYLFWCLKRKVGRVNWAWLSKWGLPWGFLCWTSEGRRKLCMVSCCNCHIYGIWTSKKVGKTLKLPFGVAMQARRRDKFQT